MDIMMVCVILNSYICGYIIYGYKWIYIYIYINGYINSS